MRHAQSALRIFNFGSKVRITHIFEALNPMKSPLRVAREKREMTLGMLAVLVGSDVGNLSRIERGVQTPSPDLAEKICKQFDGEVNELQLIYPQRYVNPADAADDSSAGQSAQ
jgi:DNA-binding XRE family transcriptional regulator